MKKLTLAVSILGLMATMQSFANEASVSFSCPTAQQLQNAFGVTANFYGFKPIKIKGTRFDFLASTYVGPNVESMEGANLTGTNFVPVSGFGPTVDCQYSMKLKLKGGAEKTQDGITLFSSGWHTHQPKTGSMEQTAYNSFVYYPDRDK